MPLVTILPNFSTVEDKLAMHRKEVHDTVKARIMEITGYNADDVLVNIARCPWILADPLSTDITLTAATCPGALESDANELCEAIAKTLAQMGFSANNGSEVWVQFLPGSWCLISGGQLVDTVPHPGATPFTQTTE